MLIVMLMTVMMITDYYVVIFIFVVSFLADIKKELYSKNFNSEGYKGLDGDPPVDWRNTRARSLQSNSKGSCLIVFKPRPINFLTTPSQSEARILSSGPIGSLAINFEWELFEDLEALANKCFHPFTK